MPELPEVETTCRGLRPHLVGRRIAALEVRDARTVVLGVVERAPNLVLQRDDELLQYQFPASYLATLLAAPNASIKP